MQLKSRRQLAGAGLEGALSCVGVCRTWSFESPLHTSCAHVRCDRWWRGVLPLSAVGAMVAVIAHAAGAAVFPPACMDAWSSTPAVHAAAIE